MDESGESNQFDDDFEESFKELFLFGRLSTRMTVNENDAIVNARTEISVAQDH